MSPRAQGFVINLATSAQRMQNAQTELERHGITPVRVEAFDGRDISLADFASYNDRKAQNFMGRSMSPGEVGCYVSHQRAAQAFLESGDSLGLVFEDDIAIQPAFGRVAPALLDWLAGRDDWHCVNIGASRLKITTPLAQFSTTKLVRAHYFPMLAHALIWNRAGAEAFLSASEPIFCPLDNMLRQILTRSDMGLATTESLVTAGRFDSDISARSGGNRRQFQRTAFYGLRKQRRLWREKAIAIAHKICGRP